MLGKNLKILLCNICKGKLIRNLAITSCGNVFHFKWFSQDNNITNNYSLSKLIWQRKIFYCPNCKKDCGK